MESLFRSLIKIIVGIVVFAGLPIAGWGLNDIKGFGENNARLAYTALTVFLQFYIVMKYPGVGRGSGRGKNTVERQHFAIILLQIFPLAIVIGAPWCDHRNIAVMDVPDSIRYLGIILFFAGFLLMNMAAAFLGRQFSIDVTIQDGHKLITGGPFKYIRHPRYLGIILFVTGIALTFRSAAALVLVVVVTAVMIWRIYDEEKLMASEFRADWGNYVKVSWRFIPFIY